MNKKLLLGALLSAGISLLNKKRRQQPAPANAGSANPSPDFSNVPPPDAGGSAGAGSLDDILARAGKPGGLGQAGGAATGAGNGGDIFGGAAPAGAAGGAAALIDIARRVFQQMQQRGGAGSGGSAGGATPGGLPGGLGGVLGEIFGRASGKFGQQGPQGPQASPGKWPDGSAAEAKGPGGLFGFADLESAGSGEAQADIMLQAMIAAAQADGRIDEAEQRNIVGALDGALSASDLAEFKQMLVNPVDPDKLVAQVQDPETALNMYLVSAMTITEDSPGEKQYMDQLAHKLGISDEAVKIIEQQLPQA